MNTEGVVEEILGKKNIILDSQILTSLMSCGRITDFKFNLNLVSINGKSNSIECGSIVHTFLETYYGCKIQGLDNNKAFQYGIAAAELHIRGCPHCSNFEGEGKPQCGHKVNSYPGLRNTPRDNEDYKTGWQYVLDTLDQYNNFYRNDHWVPLEVERVRGRILYEDDEIRILWKAKLDLVTDTNQGIYPVDHKTMKQRRDTVSMNNQFMGQCLVTDSQTVFINKIGFQKSLKPEEKFERKPISYDRARLNEWQYETLPFWAKTLLMYTEAGHFPPNFTNCEGKYGKCPFLKVCECNPDMREDKLKELFVVGPEWNPTNEDGED